MHHKTNPYNIAFVILAAGESRRMGHIKQLIEWRGKSLITHIIEKGLASEASKIFVVLGANADTIAAQIERKAVDIIYNKDWQHGLGSSVAAAMQNISVQANQYDGVLISLADQPLIEVTHFNALIDKFVASEKQIVATSFRGMPGVPAIFTSTYYPQLSSLTGTTGAKEIIRSNKHDLEIIPADEQYMDLDTPEDIEKFLARHP